MVNLSVFKRMIWVAKSNFAYGAPQIMFGQIILFMIFALGLCRELPKAYITFPCLIPSFFVFCTSLFAMWLNPNMLHFAGACVYVKLATIMEIWHNTNQRFFRIMIWAHDRNAGDLPGFMSILPSMQFAKALISKLIGATKYAAHDVFTMGCFVMIIKIAR